MNNENEIPEYALQPAKGPEIISAKGIYESEVIFCPMESQKQIYEFEEDVLVPDIKADMIDILMLQGSCSLTPKSKEIVPKTDDLVNLTGDITLQIIYKSNGEKCCVESIKTKIPYKFQWTLNAIRACTGKFSVEIKHLEYSIVNERKFRVKTTLEFCGDFYAKTEYEFFKGIDGEKLETKEEKISFTSMTREKEDIVEIDEYFQAGDRDVSPEQILRQDYVVVENYKQVTSEKAVINGFVYCNLLYGGTCHGKDSEEYVLRHHSQRIEFTQFIPLGKDKVSPKSGYCGVDFSGSSMDVAITVTEEKEYNFHIKGTVKTSIRIYENIQRSVITDAYHLEKNFDCRFKKRNLFNIVAMSNAEASTREIVSIPKEHKVKNIVFVSGKVNTCHCSLEKGRAVFEGQARCQILCEETSGDFFTLEEKLPFRGTLESAEIESRHKANCVSEVKNLWCEIINEGQIEVNGQIALNCQLTSETVLTTPENLAFIIPASEQNDYPMTVAVADGSETMWDVAKKYKTTAFQIEQVNKIEGGFYKGQKILIVK